MHGNDAPTMKDVAREAGVSLGTVSKVINGIPVGEEYRKKVEAATRKLGYQVNNYARGLKINKTNCVALIMPSLHHPFFATLTDELTTRLMQAGYRSLLMITNYDSVAEKNSYALARQNKIDGIIALSYSPQPETDAAVPMVTIDRHLGAHIPCVSSDNYQGGRLAAEALMEKGCKNLLCFRIGPNIYGEAEKRRDGFEDACRAAGVPFQTLFLSDEETEKPFYDFLAACISGGAREYDGIFCNTDGLAVRIIRFLRSRGIRVPEDMQVIGFDGIVNFPTGEYLCSTIVQPVAQIAQAAVSALLNPDTTPKNITLPVFFAPGGSTKA